MFILSYPTKQYRSAWIGIAAHDLRVIATVAGATEDEDPVLVEAAR